MEFDGLSANMVNPLPYKATYTVLDKVKGCGQYVGTSIAWQSNSVG